MTRILLVGGADDGTVVERDDPIYDEPPVEGYSGVMIMGIADPRRKWGTSGFALVEAVFAPFSPWTRDEAFTAAFGKWASAQP